MTKVSDIFAKLNEHAPVELKMGFDNVGQLAGRSDRTVDRVLVSLDITDAVIEEARTMGAQLIVSHHPLTFEGLKRVTDAGATERKFLSIIEGGISAICMHTNLDAAEGGVNDTLAAALGAKVLDKLNKEENVSRLCELPEELSFAEFLKLVKDRLSANGLRYAGSERNVKRLGLCGGAGAGDLDLAIASGCDTFLTADVKHHQFIQANEDGINLVDAGHFSTENVVVPVLQRWLNEDFPDLDVRISSHTQPERFYI
mgnify:FL=1